MSKYFDGDVLKYTESVPTTIFGEKNFIDMGINLVKAQEQYVYDEVLKTIRVSFPQVVIDKQRLEKWINFCLKLEQIEDSELVEMAVKKKISDLEEKLALYAEVIKEREDDLETLFLIRDELEKQLVEQPKQIVNKIKDFVHNNYICRRNRPSSN